MSDPILEICGLKQSFGRKTVLNGLDLALRPGECLALLGRNGAGKTTAIRTMVGQLLPDAGTVALFGENPAAHWSRLASRVGCVAEGGRLFDELTLTEYLAFQRRFFPERWDAALAGRLRKRFHLPADGKLGGFSRGMYTKAALLGVLARAPELLILDEPTLGLDVVSRREFNDGVLETLAEGGRTVLFSSHQLAELDGVCDRIAILADGRLKADLPADELRERFREVRLSRAPETLPGELARSEAAGEWRIAVDASEAAVAAELARQQLAGFRCTGMSLEAVFSVLTADAE